MGKSVQMQSGITSRSPAASAAATPAASRLPLNLSGADDDAQRRYVLFSGMSTVMVCPESMLPLYGGALKFGAA